MAAGLLNPSLGLGAGVTTDPTGDLLARQKLAELLSGGKGRYNDTSPKQHWMQALAQVADGAVEGISARQQIAAALAGQQQANGLLAAMPVGSGSLGGSGSTGSPAGRPASAGVQIPGKLGSLDDNNVDLAVRTAMAEAGSMGASGMRDVAAVLRNRALLSGKSVAAEALAPNQFEPWNPGSKNDPRRFKVDSPEYQAALAAVRPILDGSEPDPTGGATHFYAPKAQSALGRNAPSWDDGSGEDRGAHRFFRHPYAGKSPASLAQQNPADLPAPNAKPVALNPMGDEDGGALPRDAEGFAIPPAPGQGSQDPAPVPAPSQARSDLAALFSGAPMGLAQSFTGTSGMIVDPEAADMPALGAQPASATPMQVPLPPPRPSATDLQVPQAPAQAPSPARQQLAQAIAQPRTDAPDSQAAPGPAPREGIAALLGGLQDGLDRVFGGAQTQARLDTQGGARQQIAQALTPPTPGQYAALPPAGQPAPQVPGVAQPARAAAQPIPPQPVPGAAPQAVAEAPERPVQVAQAGGGQQDGQVAWARQVLAASAANPAVAKLVPMAQEILKGAMQPKMEAPFDYQGGKVQRDPSTGEYKWVLKPGDAGDKYQHVQLPNGGVFAFNPANPDTSKMILPGQPARPLTPEERTAFGIPTGQGAMMGPEGPKAIGGGGTTVNVDTKGPTEFAKVANGKQAERYSKMVDAADEAVAIRGDIDTLSDLGGKISTGRLAEARLGIAQYAKALGADDLASNLTGGKLSEMEAYQALADKLAPRMRVPGSGATSDYEMRVFRNSLPSLLKTPGGNAIAVDTFRSLSDYQAAVGEIAGQALRGEIQQKDADAQIRGLDSPFLRFKEYRKEAARGEAAVPAPAAPAAAPAAPAPAPAAPDRSALEAEARRRGLIR